MLRLPPEGRQRTKQYETVSAWLRRDERYFFMAAYICLLFHISLSNDSNILNPAQTMT
jgi:hypothetical protein